MKSKIDYQEIIKLLNLVEERNLLDFELEVEGFRIKITRGQTLVLPQTKTASPETTQEVINKSASPKEQEQPEKNNLHYIISPMVGTFYRAPNPSAPSYIEIGETVKKNQVLCII
ncbi:MAG: acetyl-CoA carboxylase biotin carboxyl carrier protein, partial [Acidobacteriota bacterium]